MSFDVIQLHLNQSEPISVHRGVINGGSSRRSDLSAFAARCRTTVGIAGPFAAALLMPTPRSQIALLTDPRPDVVVGAIALLIAIAITWLLVTWALVVLGVAAASRIPGFVGAGARRLLMSITPAAVHRIVMMAAGVSVAAGLAACGSSGSSGALPVGAAPAPAVVSASTTAASPFTAPALDTATAPSNATRGDDVFDFTVDLDWPITADTAASHMTTPAAMTAPEADVVPDDAEQPIEWGDPAAPDPAAPDPAEADPAAPDPAAPDPAEADPAEADPAAPDPAVGTVTVRPGDSLWSIAAAHLPDNASAAQIDGEWRAWYRANRDVVGADPNIVIPGQQLHAPTTDTDTAALTTFAPQETIQ